MIRDKHPPKRYELWESSQGCVQSYFPEDNVAALATLERDAVMIWSCVAESYVEVQERRHERLGWPPYKTPSEWNEE